MYKRRCSWCTNDEDYIYYHDNEWGIPCYDERKLFELLLLEGFQAGLSWLTVLKKRQHYKKVLYNFDPYQVAIITDDYIEQLLKDEGIIRNRIKLLAARNNAQAWLKLEKPVQWMWSFVNGQPKINHFACTEEVPTTSSESKIMSNALKKAGFSFVGPTICYAYMQAVGMIMDHTQDCFMYPYLLTMRSHDL